MQAIPVPVFERHNTCLACGYDLFGQPRLGTCPECGTSTRESARDEAFLESAENVAELRFGTLLLLWSSILAGLCPGVCLLLAAVEGSVGLAMLMTLVFAGTAITAAIGERRLLTMGEYSLDDGNDAYADAKERPSFIGDLNAGAGLLVINIAGYVYSMRIGLFGKDVTLAVLVGIGFFLLAIAAWRAIPAYRMRANVARACLGGSGVHGLVGLGRVKAIYETLWLSCCSLAPLTLAFDFEEPGILFAFAAMFGLIGYGVLWIIMITLHAVLFAKVRRRLGERRGFEVLAATQA